MWDKGLVHRLKFLTWPFRRVWCVLVGHKGFWRYYYRHERTGEAMPVSEQEDADWGVGICCRCRAQKRWDKRLAEARQRRRQRPSASDIERGAGIILEPGPAHENPFAQFDR